MASELAKKIMDDLLQNGDEWGEDDILSLIDLHLKPLREALAEAQEMVCFADCPAAWRTIKELSKEWIDEIEAIADGYHTGHIRTYLFGLLSHIEWQRLQIEERGRALEAQSLTPDLARKVLALQQAVQVGCDEGWRHKAQDGDCGCWCQKINAAFTAFTPKMNAALREIGGE